MKRDGKKIRIIIAGMDAGVRSDLRTAVTTEPDVQVIAECVSAAEVVRALQAYRPDVLMLAIQLADSPGMAVVEHIGPDRMPATVFIANGDQDAVAALDAHALDYISTPVDRNVTAALMQQIRDRIHAGAPADRSGERLADYLANGASPRGGEPAEPGRLTRFMIRERDRIRFIAAEDVDWIEGARNYVRLRVGDRSHLLRGPLTAILEQLDPAMFTRIHRSIIVNVDRIAEIQPWVGGDCIAVLRSGERLRVSRNFRSRVAHIGVRA